MAKTKSLPSRNQVLVEDTWDLTPLFRDDAAWERAYKKLEKMIGGFEQFRGRLGESAEVLRACFEFEVVFEKQAEALGSYAHLKTTEDVANNTYQGLLARYIRLATRSNEAASYIAPEIRAIPLKKMEEYLKSPVLKPFRFSLEKLLRYRKHILSAKEERILAMQGEVADTADKVFSQLNDADLKFGQIKDERGVTVELTQSSFRSLLESPKREVRKEAFNKFYATYEAHENTLAATLSSSVLHDLYHARVRNHPSAIEAALFGDRVPVSVYENLITAVRGNLDTLYRYFDVRKKALKLKDLHFYDTYAPIVPTARANTPYSHAVDMVITALAPLGTDYCRTLENGLTRGRWVDRYENQGKRSGAFSSGGYTSPPYILMNYKEDVLDHVFTLAHEAGHSMHTHYSAENQTFQDYHYTIFVAEVASTFNEQLLNAHLLKSVRDKKTRARLINREIDEIRGTLIRQTMFAEFEKNIHAIAEEGIPLTLEQLRAEYRVLLDAYFGPRFVIDDTLSLECFRIPHFYSAFYVYKYATGLAAAIALSRQVLSGGTEERDRYLAFLKSGGSNYPLDLLRTAGVDMETPDPINATMEHFRELVAELEELV